MALLLDACALIAVERGDREVLARLLKARFDRVPVRTTTAVVAQVWRDGGRQARLARLVNTTDERPLDQDAARRIGLLLGASGMADVVDASLVDLAVPGDEILTSDPADIIRLVDASGKEVQVTPIG